MKHWKQQWRIFLAAGLVVVAVWMMSLDHPRVALPIMLVGLGLFLWDGREFRREQREYELESDASLERLRAHCTTPPHGEEED